MMGITSGLNSRGGMITSELNTAYFDFIIEVITALVGDWYVRLKDGSQLIGPMTFQEADAQARFWSNPEREKRTELVTFLGARGGDPVTIPAKLCVKYLYIYGKRTMGGRVATFHSKNGLLEIMP